jgi:hypothetical protein
MHTVDSPRVDSSPTGDGFSASSFLQIGIMSTTVLDRFLDPVTDCLTPAVAERIVGVRVDAETQMRLDELAQKANLGELTEQEREEYAEYIEGMDLVGILKAKARKVLERRVG